MESILPLIKDLPEPETASRFFEEFSERHPSATRKFLKDRSLLSDVLALSAYSPLLATTILQHPEYVRWLGRERKNPKVREKDELLESLARFALTNTTLELGVMFARFRRRELIRIFLKDIRSLATIAEITEEISNLADAILEHALMLSRQELDNRFGMPLETDSQGKSTRAELCVVALGKLGSKELNYSSDIDLLFLYSSDGKTSGQGKRGRRTNKEYFVKLAEFVSRMVGEQTGEGGAYRVDHRLRPHGRVGSLAVSLREATAYYKRSAHLWEKQVLIRSRCSAGDPEVFNKFYKAVEPYVFSPDETVENALGNVLRSKQKIDLEKIRSSGFDVKLGVGGIREIEFIAQALQLAFGAKDRWLRAPHTLISLSRLSDRRLISENEFNELFEAYVFLRRVEHRLQMENGLQTHFVPEDAGKQAVIGARMGFGSADEFRSELRRHTSNVARVFKRFFDHTEYAGRTSDPSRDLSPPPVRTRPISEVLEAGEATDVMEHREELRLLRRFSPQQADIVAGNPELLESLPSCKDSFAAGDPESDMRRAIEETTFSSRLSSIRRIWAREHYRILVSDLCRTIGTARVRKEETRLAEASIAAAYSITELELRDLYSDPELELSLAVIGLGKLGGGGMDYHSDLDLVLVYDDDSPAPVSGTSHAEFFARAVEIFVTVISSLTRDGSLYRVDLRLRPDGKNGATSIGRGALLDYLRNRSAVWEWLAWAKARCVLKSGAVPDGFENEIKSVLCERAGAEDRAGLEAEVWRIRQRLEKEKASGNRGRSIDIKYGEGGLQDVYFAVRYLQLISGITDETSDRSTLATLKRLLEAGTIEIGAFHKFDEGYRFLTELDHNIRIAAGRSSVVPLANRKLMKAIAERMNADSAGSMLETLAGHRIAVREAFEEVLGRL